MTTTIATLITSLSTIVIATLATALDPTMMSSSTLRTIEATTKP
jgi:hypothetical protein